MVDDQDQHVRAVADRRRQLLSGHHEVAVAGDDDHLPVPMPERRRDAGGHAVAHRSIGRGELARLLGIAPVAMPRSEEHTSELQSLMRISYAVFCLKKKTKKTSR